MRGAALALFAGSARAHNDDDPPPRARPADYWDRRSFNNKCDHAFDCCKVNGTVVKSCVSQAGCEAFGCCWDAHGTGPTSYWCSGPRYDCREGGCSGANGVCDAATGACACRKGFAGASCSDAVPAVVHVVQSCHLDVGFTDTLVGVMNKYFDSYIPAAIKEGRDLRNRIKEGKIPAGWQLRFMMQAYYINLYVHCPAELKERGLHCPSTQQIADFEDAVSAGDITWHAFPHNGELEMGTAKVLKEGVALAHRVDDELKVPRKTTLSQRDVPGIARSVIPVLADAGVTGVSVGVNTASMYPRVPKLFRWQDPISGKEVYALWHGRGYGGYSAAEAVRVPGLDHVLVTDWNGDNAGPRSADQYVQHLQAIQKEFPGAEIVTSTFDNFTSLLAPVKGAIPVLTQEIGDTWLYGCPSDPRKHAETRALHRAWDAYGGPRDAAYLNATALLVKCIEHTWGENTNKHLQKHQKASDWQDDQFVKDRPTTDFTEMEKVWWEQRDWCVNATIVALGQGHPLRPIAEQELAAVRAGTSAPDPASDGYAKVDASQTFTVNGVELGFDARTGAVARLTDPSGATWAAPTAPLFEVRHTLYNQSEFAQYQRAYSNLTKPPGYFPHDFGKQGDSLAVHKDTGGRLVSLWRNDAAFWAEVAMQGGCSGCPERVWLHVAVAADGGSADVTALVAGKTATRHGEAMFLRWRPPGSGAGKWEMDKLGQWVALEPNLTVDGGAKRMHGVDSGVRFTSGGRTLTIGTVDAGVAVFGAPTGFPIAGPYGDAEPELSEGASSMLWNNLWGTNYIMWYPYWKDGKAVPGAENLKYRYVLRWG